MSEQKQRPEKQQKEINEIKRWFFKMTNKIDKAFTGLRKKEKIQSNMQEMKTKDITTDTTEIQNISIIKMIIYQQIGQPRRKFKFFYTTNQE